MCCAEEIAMTTANKLLTSNDAKLLARIDQDPSAIVPILDRCEAWLDQHEDVASLKKIQQTSGAIVRLFRTVEEASELMNRASIIRVNAERKIGKWLSGNIRHGGNYKVKPFTLKDVQITHSQSSRWQMIASLPRDKFDSWIDERIARGWSITTGGLIAYARNVNNNPPQRRKFIPREIKHIQEIRLSPDLYTCALLGVGIVCDGPLTTEHIIRKSAYQGSKKLKRYYENKMNKARTCYRHNVGKWADAPFSVKVLVIQKIFEFGWSDTHDYFNSAPWKTGVPHEWTIEAMLDAPIRTKV